MNLDYSDAPAYATILAILCIIVGLAIATSGYRYHRAAMVASALFAAGNYVVMLLFASDDRFLGDDNWYFLAFVTTGIVCGALGRFHTKTGVVITGFCAGVALTTMIMDLIQFQIMVVGYDVILTIGGTICGGLALVLKKPGLVGATSFVGAIVFMDGVRFFVFKKIYDDYQKEQQDATSNSMFDASFGYFDTIGDAWRIMIVVVFALFAVAVAVQMFVTARGIDRDAPAEPADPLAEFTKVETPQQHDAKARAGAKDPISLV